MLVFAQTAGLPGVPGKGRNPGQNSELRILPRFKNTTGQLELLAFNQGEPS
jgi:hypothetical protein